MKNKILLIIILLGIVAIIGFYLNNGVNLPYEGKTNLNEKIDIVTSLEDQISDNSAWCGTFNLIWNDLKNDLAKQDIVFTEQLIEVDNLNKGTFTAEHLSDESYYKTYGVPTLDFKKQIEREIKKKFNETSDILDDFDWENRSEKDYFLYCMLKKEFEFPKVFDKLENGVFGNNKEYVNVKYFGIDESTKEQVANQVSVLYYNSENDFAVKLKTKSNDEVIIAVGNNANDFLTMYNLIIENQKNYNGNHRFNDGDILKIPYITFDLKEEFAELENKVFSFSNGEPYSIEKALQTIKFELDEKGGRIKSEAGMMAKNEAALMPNENEPRRFIVDEAFTIFLIEKEKELPYFAAKISDISTVQTGVKSNVAVKEGEPNLENELSGDVDKQQEYYFYGTVVEANLDYIIVEPYENEQIRKSANRISIGLGEYNDMLYMVGTNLKITYTGEVMETYPAQINVLDMEIKSAETNNIRSK